MNLENKPQKNTKNYTNLLFLAISTPKMGHPGGGRASPFFHLFSSLGPIWAPLGSTPPKMVPRASLREPKVASGGYFLKLFGVDV